MATLTTFYAGQSVRDLAGRFRKLPAYLDAELEFILTDEANLRLLDIVRHTPRRSGGLANSFRLGEVRKTTVAITTTRPEQLRDVEEGTASPIVPTGSSILRFYGGFAGFPPGPYFRKFVFGQRPNGEFHAALERARHAAIDTQVVARRISAATRAARL